MADQATNGSAAGGVAGTQAEKQFAIQRLYLKDISFESPHVPALFREKWEPKVNVELGTENNQLDEHTYEVVLRVTVTVTQNDKPAFLIEIKQAGIFNVVGFDKSQLNAMLGAYCPNILFPYAREQISQKSVAGGFPALYIAPVNFDALYAQEQQRLQAEQQGTATAENTTGN